MRNQIRSKLLFKHIFITPKIKSIRLTSNFNKLKSFNDDIVLEGLFLLEFIGSLKANVNYYKKMYQEVNIQILSILRRHYLFYHLFLLKIFYFPLLIRRNVFLKESFDKNYNYAYTVKDINSFALLPDIFFKWNVPINCFINFDGKAYIANKLYLQYWNFPVYK